MGNIVWQQNVDALGKSFQKSIGTESETICVKDIYRSWLLSLA